MKKFLGAVILLLLSVSPILVSAQVNHFIYLQTEGRQPFYAKLDNKVYSSSGSGYLIIPKLKGGTYNITIGFPRNENKEQNYTCNINNKDVGYLIKNFGEKGWGLFNMQTLDVVMAGSPHKEERETALVEKTDEFSSMLSDVVKDPSIKQQEKSKTVIKEEIAKKEDEKVVQAKVAESVKIDNTAGLNEAGGQSVPAAVEKQTQPVIIKKQVVTGESGTEIIYI